MRIVPNAAIMNGLGQYANPDYAHRTSWTVTSPSPTSTYGGHAWKTMLVGTLGRGGPGMFALDITNPADIHVPVGEERHGHPGARPQHRRPVIAQVANGDWRVILGNGAG